MKIVIYARTTDALPEPTPGEAVEMIARSALGHLPLPASDRQMVAKSIAERLECQPEGEQRYQRHLEELRQVYRPHTPDLENRVAKRARELVRRDYMEIADHAFEIALRKAVEKAAPAQGGVQNAENQGAVYEHDVKEKHHARR